MKAIQFDRIGLPTEVLELREVATPRPAPGEALVKVTAASINPGDFLFIQSLYPEPKKPKLPAQTAGSHAFGVVVEAGQGVGLAQGTTVAFSYDSAWAEYVAIPEAWCIPVPWDLPMLKAAQLMNIVTAWDLVEAALVSEGDWLGLTAGSATVSTMVAQLAKRRGVEVLSVVRREHADLDLRAMGSTDVLELAEVSGDITAAVADRTRGKGLAAVIDCVGGPVLGDLVRSFEGFGGKVVIYGGYSQARFSLHNFDLLMKGISVVPYAYRYFFDPPPAADAAILRRIVEEAARPEFLVRSAGIHPLEDFAKAVRETWERPEQGKRFFAPGR